MNDGHPTHLDLFSGIGGFALAARQAGFRTIGFCEIDPYCQKVLAKNFLADAVRERRQQIAGSAHGNEAQNEGRPSELHHELAGCSESGRARIYSNIFEFDGTRFRGVDLITGGFPCQPFSVAGKRAGAADDRHLWPEMLRVIAEARPAWVLGENVLGIIGMELDNVLSDLEGVGYATRAFVIPACAVDARHRRDRLWIIAHTNGNGARERHNSNAERGNASEIRSRRDSADSQNARSDTGERDQTITNSGGGTRLEGQRQISSRIGAQFGNTGVYCRWQPEPDVGRVAHGVPNRVDRLRGLGNAIVPQVACEIMIAIRHVGNRTRSHSSTRKAAA